MSMRRREFIQLLAGVAATRPLPARAQRPNPPRIGYLSPHSSLTASDRAFLQGLRELGYVEGSNIFIEFRFADGKFDRLPALAAELVRLDVAVIVTAVTQASLAARLPPKPYLPLVLGLPGRSSFESRATRSRLRMTEKGRSLLKQEGISMKVGLSGLGRMGQAMARRLLEAKHGVGVYNRTPEKIKDIVAGGAKSLNSIEQACRYGTVVFSMLADDAALAEVSEQNGGLLQSLPKGGIQSPRHAWRRDHQKTHGGA